MVAGSRLSIISNMEASPPASECSAEPMNQLVE